MAGFAEVLGKKFGELAHCMETLLPEDSDGESVAREPLPWAGQNSPESVEAHLHNDTCRPPKFLYPWLFLNLFFSTKSFGTKPARS